MKTIKAALLALCVIASVTEAGSAVAQDRRYEGERGREHVRDPGPYRGQDRGGMRAPQPYPVYRQGDGYAAPYAPPYRPGPVYSPRPTYPSAAPDPGRLRRGQYMPHAYWGAEIANPRGRHLRAPPPGYGWIGVGRDAYLMQRSTGLILDSVPGAW